MIAEERVCFLAKEKGIERCDECYAKTACEISLLITKK